MKYVDNWPSRGVSKKGSTRVGYLKPRHSHEVVDSAIGFEYAQQRHPELNAFPHDLLPGLLAQTGAKWVRLRYPWPLLEIGRGQYDWSVLDKIVSSLVEKGLNVFLGSEAMANPLYQDVPSGRYLAVTNSEEGLDAFCRHMAAMVSRYRDKVRYYELWNEPNHPGFWQPTPDPKAYALLVRRANDAMRAVDPDIKLVAGAVAGAKVDFTRAFLSEPQTARCVDVVTYHVQGQPIPENGLEHLLEFVGMVHAIGPNIEVWNGETAIPSGGDSLQSRASDPWGMNIQAKWALRRVLTDLRVGATRTIIYPFAENLGPMVAGDPDSGMGINTKGALQYGTWQPKPIYYAVRNMAALVDCSWGESTRDEALTILHPGSFWGIGAHEQRYPCRPMVTHWTRKDVHRVAAWLPWRPQEIVMPAKVGLRLQGVVWKDPVWVDVLSGEVHACERQGDAILGPLADYPVFFTERESIDVAQTPAQPGETEFPTLLRWDPTEILQQSRPRS